MSTEARRKAARKYTAEEKTTILAEWAKSENKARFAEAHGIPFSTIYGWADKATKPGQTEPLKDTPARRHRTKNALNGQQVDHKSASTFRVFMAVERELMKAPPRERAKIINYLRARLGGAE